MHIWTVLNLASRTCPIMFPLKSNSIMCGYVSNASPNANAPTSPIKLFDKSKYSNVVTLCFNASARLWHGFHRSNALSNHWENYNTPLQL